MPGERMVGEGGMKGGYKGERVGKLVEEFGLLVGWLVGYLVPHFPSFKKRQITKTTPNIRPPHCFNNLLMTLMSTAPSSGAVHQLRPLAPRLLRLFGCCACDGGGLAGSSGGPGE